MIPSVALITQNYPVIAKQKRLMHQLNILLIFVNLVRNVVFLLLMEMNTITEVMMIRAGLAHLFIQPHGALQRRFLLYVYCADHHRCWFHFVIH